MLRKEWPGVLQTLDPEGFSFPDGVFLVGANRVFRRTGERYSVAIRARPVSILSHAFSRILTFLSFVITCYRAFSGVLDFRPGLQSGLPVWRDSECNPAQRGVAQVLAA